MNFQGQKEGIEQIARRKHKRPNLSEGARKRTSRIFILLVSFLAVGARAYTILGNTIALRTQNKASQSIVSVKYLVHLYLLPRCKLQQVTVANIKAKKILGGPLC